MDSRCNNDLSPYIYPQSTYYGKGAKDTMSVASYEEIFTLPWRSECNDKENPYINCRDKEAPYTYGKNKEHTYITFDDTYKSVYNIDDIFPPTSYYKKKTTCKIPKYVVIMFAILLVMTAITTIFLIKKYWFSSKAGPIFSVPDKIPYEGEEWFVPVEQWGMKPYLKNCSQFSKVTKITVTPIQIDDMSCGDIKACEDYLCAYDTNTTVVNHDEWQYEFFFGKDNHVFEGRNWHCFYKSGELSFGYLVSDNEDYNPQKLGPAWKHIRFAILDFGIENKLVAEDVCYNVDPDNVDC